MRKPFLALTALICAGLSGPTLAATDADGHPSTAVRTSDLNLTMSADQARLQRRVKAAAHAICSTGTRDVGSLAREQQCFMTAMRSAQVQIVAMIEKATRVRS